MGRVSASCSAMRLGRGKENGEEAGIEDGRHPSKKLVLLIGCYGNDWYDRWGKW